MLRHLLAVPLLVLVAMPAVSAPAPKESWGKAGISLAQYRQDSLDCGLKGYYTDISKTADAKAFVTASRQLDTVTSGGASAPATVESSGTGPDTTNAVDQLVQYANQQQHIVDSVHADERFHSIKKTLVSTTEACLQARGYSRFALTAEQRHRLGKLKAGSDERRAYLYALASDPTVVQGQKETTQP